MILESYMYYQLFSMRGRCLWYISSCTLLYEYYAVLDLNCQYIYYYYYYYYYCYILGFLCVHSVNETCHYKNQYFKRKINIIWTYNLTYRT